MDAIPDSGEIRIKVKEDGGNVMMAVSDSGVGIPDKDIGMIFKPFYTTKAKGTGLGLAIVDRYVKALGAEFKVESMQGKGSAFYITMPKRQ